MIGTIVYVVNVMQNVAEKDINGKDVGVVYVAKRAMKRMTGNGVSAAYAGKYVTRSMSGMVVSVKNVQQLEMKAILLRDVSVCAVVWLVKTCLTIFWRVDNARPAEPNQ